jgi:hypothetical protein
MKQSVHRLPRMRPDFARSIISSKTVFIRSPEGAERRRQVGARLEIGATIPDYSLSCLRG